MTAVEVTRFSVGLHTCRRCRRSIGRLLHRGRRVEFAPVLTEVPRDLLGLRCPTCRRVFVVEAPGPS